EILGGIRRKHIVRARREIVQTLRQKYYTYGQIAKYLNRTQVSIARLIQPANRDFRRVGYR
ncbi:MAG TPA: hypothetical protein VN794_01265, partial [Methylomirabilota bacterium]|nr:hypothetical protein [Methylomirabilota bacterium]